MNCSSLILSAGEKTSCEDLSLVPSPGVHRAKLDADRRRRLEGKQLKKSKKSKERKKEKKKRSKEKGEPGLLLSHCG